VVQVREVLRIWLRGQGERPAARAAGVDRKTARSPAVGDELDRSAYDPDPFGIVDTVVLLGTVRAHVVFRWLTAIACPKRSIHLGVIGTNLVVRAETVGGQVAIDLAWCRCTG
jgi:hypothetical protein